MDKIITLAQYGNVLIPNKDLAAIRGKGEWNPPPIWEQSTNRGNSWMNAYPIYTQNQSTTNNQMRPEPIDVSNLDLAHFNTPSDLGDFLRKNIYEVGSTGLHAQPPSSWIRREYQGAQNQYTEWALKSLLQGGMTPTPLALYFFSNENVKYLQDRTKQEVRKINNEVINDQSVDELLIIMRNKILYAYSGWLPNENDPNKITSRGEKPCTLEFRLSRLNKSVLEETVKQVLSGINQYKIYVKDMSSLPMPLSLPVNTSMAGSRQLSEPVGYNSGLERTVAAQSFNERYNII